MSETEVDALIETIDNTCRYRLQLSELLDGLNQAKAQVKQSADVTRQQVKDQIAHIKSSVLQALDDRELELLHEIDTVENTAVNPLLQCEDMINTGISQAASVMSEGKTLLMSDHNTNKDNIGNFSRKVNDLDLNSLPEVPSLADVASLSIHFSPSIVDDLQLLINDYGTMSSRAPVKIAELSQRPGALLVKWAEVEHEDENAPDITEFKLQYAPADVTPVGHESYETVYQGPNMQYLIRHIQENKPYSFRVCCRGDEGGEWSTYCVPQIARTSLKHNEWKSSVQGYTISNDNQLVCIDCSPTSPLPVIYSSQPSYVCGHGLEFHILDTAEEFDDGGIGLSFNTDTSDTLSRPGTLFVNFLGQVYMDGKKLTTVLPPLTKGSTLTFDTELIPPNKIRVSIETNDKQVTVDWKEEKEESLLSMQTGASSNVDLYFALQFQSIGWKVLVQ